MASDFDALLAERTQKGAATIHGAIMKCVDKHGTEIYSRTTGYNSVSPDAPPLREDAVLKLGSATKLITTIALLQCVDAGLLTLDEPISRILPELSQKPILEGVTGSGELVTRPSTTPITARHLLSHTSGLGYWFTHPLLMMKWRTASAHGRAAAASSKLTERMDYPLVFEPGEGWAYGCNLDWAGVAVSRLHGGISLEEYMVSHIWQKLGRSAPFPTFHLEKHPDYEARLMQCAERTKAGGLQHSAGMAFCAHLDDDEGGAGLCCTAGDYLAVLGDLISDTPKLLKPQTIALMFESQLSPATPGIPMLQALRPAWDMVAGSEVKGDEVNHGLGGLLVQGEAEGLRQPAGLLCWAGSPNIVWFVGRGVAGVLATQVAPFGDKSVKEVVDGWKRDFWETVKRDHGFGNRT